MPTFQEQLNEQIAHEFAASQQYIAIAVHYDAETLPQLAAHFYRQAVEERNHAMMMVQYLLDSDDEVIVPAVAAPKVGFADLVAPVALALDQEKRVTEQISQLAVTARQAGDLVAEQFMHWFLQEQREEVASMSALLQVVERLRDNVMLVEDYLARESGGENALEAGAPPVAGGDLSATIVVELRLQTERQSQLVDITRLVADAVAGHDGSAVLVYVPHTTAGVTVNEHADPAVARDFASALERIVPSDWSWEHVEEGEENAPTHIRASLMGPSVLIPLRGDGGLALGTWQGVFFCEFDGPRQRSVYVTVLA